jgi:PHD/YefM family antitoxin component YafN of YafNO toxin-antitoxin module
MQMLNIRPVTDLRNKFSEIEADIKSGLVFFTKNGYGASVMLSIDDYQMLVDPMEEILSETDRLAEEDARRFTSADVYRRLKNYAERRIRVRA